MVRLVQRRLIIPRGDTGTIEVPMLKNVTRNNAIAVFSIFNNEGTIYQQTQVVQGDTLTFIFEHEDTVALQVGIYNWDIKIYVNPQYNANNLLIDGEQVHSYYAGFKVPECDIVLAPKEGG